MSHSRLSPSAMSRLIACPASLRLDGQEDRGENPYANLGTVAHKVAETWLRDGMPPDPPLVCSRCKCEVTETPPCQACGCSERYADAEMLEHVKTYVEFVFGLGGTVEVERRIESKRAEGFGGTIDAIVRYVENGKLVLHIVDLKYGAGVDVRAKGNKQLLSYLLLADETEPDARIFRMTIVQPRVAIGDVIETVEVDGDGLDQHFEAIEKIESRAKTEDPVTGDHCRWCPAAGNCPATEAAALAVTKMEFSEEIEASKIADALALVPAIEAFIDSLKSKALDMMERGTEVPGFKAVQGIGRRKWCADEDTILQKLRNRKIGKKLATRTAIKSPAQLEKDVELSKFEDLITRTSPAPRVVPTSAPGKAIEFKPVLEHFAEEIHDDII